MAVGAPLNNNNAEKWTYELALELFSRAFELSEDKELYSVGKESIEGFRYDFIGELVNELKKEYKHVGRVHSHLLSRDLPGRFEDLKTEWEDLKSVMETNCYSNTKKGIINTAVGIINLKSNHKWTDRSTNDVSLTHNNIFESINLDVTENNSPD